jgi:hypothetical protein
MDGLRFDALTRSLRESRRSLLRGALALTAGRFGVADAGARNKHKHKKRRKKAKPNAFGCLSVGKSCQNADQCCSGICEGKTCRAHDTGTCDQKRPGYCAEGNPNDASCNGGKGVCFRTTAGSNVCINNFLCAECKRDADCVALGYPAGAACVPVGGDLACADLCQEAEIRMACVYGTPEA